MNEVLEEKTCNTDNEHLQIIKKEELKEVEKKHSKHINIYELLIAATMTIYSICDDMSYIDVKNIIFVVIAYFFFSMVQIKVVEKLLEHIFKRSIIKSKLDNYDDHFVWKYKDIKKCK